MERWLSGRKRHAANVLGEKSPPGFESLPLRQDEFLFFGRVPEWFKGTVLKTVVPERVP